MTTIQRYTEDFKQDAIRYVEEHPTLTMEQAALYLDIPKESLYGWVKVCRRQLREGLAASATAPMSDAEKEIARLKRENRDLQDALEVLKRQSAF